MVYVCSSCGAPEDTGLYEVKKAPVCRNCHASYAGKYITDNKGRVGKDSEE